MDQHVGGADEITLIEVVAVIKSQKKMISCLVIIVTVLTALYTLTMPKYYRAEVTILPIGGGGSGGGALAALAGQFTGISSLGGGAGTARGQLVALLKTKSLAEEMVRTFDLASAFADRAANESVPPPSMESLVSTLLGSVTIREDKSMGTIALSTELQDPQLAAKIANGYLDALQKLIMDSAFTAAKRNRLFIQRQLEENKRELLEAGKGLNEFYKSGKVSNVDSKVTVPIDSDWSKGVEILNQKKDEIDHKLSVKNVPQQIYLQYLTLRRNLLIQVNTMLTQQYEMARIDEAKEDLAFQVIDPARVPEQRSRPRRTRIVAASFMLSLFAGIFLAFFFDYLGRNGEKTK